MGVGWMYLPGQLEGGRGGTSLLNDEAARHWSNRGEYVHTYLQATKQTFTFNRPSILFHWEIFARWLLHTDELSDIERNPCLLLFC